MALKSLLPTIISPSSYSLYGGRAILGAKFTAPMIRMVSAQQSLKALRRIIHSNARQEALPFVNLVNTYLLSVISKGIDPNHPYIAYYHATRIMMKMIKGSPRPKDSQTKNAIQILLIDSSGEMVLAQKRGRYKRLFADTITVSANAKPKKDDDIKNALNKAVKDEVGIEINENSIELIGQPRSFKSSLISYDFYAFTTIEEQALQIIANKLNNNGSSIKHKYDTNKRALFIYSQDQNDQASLDKLAEQIHQQTGVEPIYPVADKNLNSLAIYRLTKEEERQIKHIIANNRTKTTQAKQRLLSGSPDLETVRSALTTVDSDQMSFRYWASVFHDFSRSPQSFALDLTSPYFGDWSIWKSLGCKISHIIDSKQELASLNEVSGGKGKNTHFLQTIDGITVPDTKILTTFLFDELVCGRSDIKTLIKRLDGAATTAGAKRIAKRIRTRIETVEFPEDVKEMVAAAFNELGGDIAVRSSSTFEDADTHTAAGRADSFLHQIKIDDVLDKIKKVWSSLFSDRFVAYRNDAGVSHSSVKMAVMLQKFISPVAAGVVFSFDQATNRPVYLVSAQPGICQGVVEGEGNCDQWYFGLLTGDLLKKHIARKTLRYVALTDGDTQEEKIDQIEPSISDELATKIAKQAAQIHLSYRKELGIEHIDLEYAINHAHQISIVQARPKMMQGIIHSAEGITLRTKSVDDSNLPPNFPMLKLNDNSLVAYSGAVNARLRLYRTFEPVVNLAGQILVTTHTNNEFNSIFGSLAGVITTDGDQTSHAAQHAYEKKIPCLVGANGAFEALRKYDGVIVTFDSRRKKIYLGQVPITDYDIPIDIWLQTEEQVAASSINREKNEAFRPWQESKEKRPEIFIEDFEGRWRRRSNHHPYFQLDFWCQAWERLTSILNEHFGERSPWQLKTQRREIKFDSSAQYLFQEYGIDDDPHSIYNFIRSAKDFTAADLTGLFQARWQGFKAFASFMNKLERANDSNISELIDHLTEIYAWMHFGFWLDAITEEVVYDQYKYIDNNGAFHNILREEAAARIPACELIDSKRGELPNRQVMNISSLKDKEIYSIMEDIYSNAALQDIFINKEPRAIQAELINGFPVLLAKIDSWSTKYKHKTEDVAIQSDTLQYIIDLKDRIIQSNIPHIGMVAYLFKCLAMAQMIKPEDYSRDQILSLDPDLHQTIKLLARGLNLPNAQEGYRQTIVAIIAHLNAEKPIRKKANDVLDNYPDIAELAALSKMQLTLREDGHHLVLPHVRKAGRLLLELAAKYVPSIFNTKEDIFQLSADEIIALVTEDDPAYLTASFTRRRKLLTAEKELEASFKISAKDLTELSCPTKASAKELFSDLVKNKYLDEEGRIQELFLELGSAAQMSLASVVDTTPVFQIIKARIGMIPQAIKDFEVATEQAINTIQNQKKCATLPRVKKDYDNETKRLRDRVVSLKDRAKNFGL